MRWPLTSCPWWWGTLTLGRLPCDRAELGVQKLSLSFSMFMWVSNPISCPELAHSSRMYWRPSVTSKPPSLNVLGPSGYDSWSFLEGNMSDVLSLADGSICGHECGCGCGFNAWTSLWALSLFPGSSIWPPPLHPRHALLTDTKPCTHPAGGNKSPHDCILLP